MGRGGGGGGGGGHFMVLVKRCKKLKGPPLFLANFCPEKFSLHGANFRYCSKNFVLLPTLLLQNKNKNNKINKTLG